MREYVEEALSQGYIHSSKPPLLLRVSSLYPRRMGDSNSVSITEFRTTSQSRIAVLFPLSQQHGNIFMELGSSQSWTFAANTTSSEYVRMTTFITPNRHFEYLVMPNGLPNDPSVFQGFRSSCKRLYSFSFYGF